MQGSIKQLNIFITIAAVNAKIICVATLDITTVGIINGSSSQTQVYRGTYIATTSGYMYTLKFKVKIVASCM